ncbi:hypothetical protein D3C73_1079730 [compost metagenome]
MAVGHVGQLFNRPALLRIPLPAVGRPVIRPVCPARSHNLEIRLAVRLPLFIHQFVSGQHSLLCPAEQSRFIARLGVLVQIAELGDEGRIIAPQRRRDRPARQFRIALPVAAYDVHHRLQIQIAQRRQIIPPLRVPAAACIGPEGGPHPVAAVGNAHPFSHRGQMADRILVILEGRCGNRAAEMNVPAVDRLGSRTVQRFQLKIIPFKP